MVPFVVPAAAVFDNGWAEADDVEDEEAAGEGERDDAEDDATPAVCPFLLVCAIFAGGRRLAVLVVDEAEGNGFVAAPTSILALCFGAPVLLTLVGGNVPLPASFATSVGSNFCLLFGGESAFWSGLAEGCGIVGEPEKVVLIGEFSLVARGIASFSSSDDEDDARSESSSLLFVVGSC